MIKISGVPSPRVEIPEWGTLPQGTFLRDGDNDLFMVIDVDNSPALGYIDFDGVTTPFFHSSPLRLAEEGITITITQADQKDT